VPATIAFYLLGVTELSQAYHIARTIDLSVFGYGIAAITIGAFSGAMFGKESWSYD
jgi:hypothetical protein